MRILLDEIMKQKKLTTRQAEIMTGISRSTVANIAKHKRIPRMDTMEQLAAGLKVRISDLYESDYK